MSDIKVKTEEITSSSAASQSQEQNEVKIEATTTEASADTPSSSVDLKLQEPPVKNLTVVKETYLYDGSGKPNLIEYSSSAQSSSNAANIRPTKKAKIEKNKEEYFLEIRWLKDFDSMDEPRGERSYYVSHSPSSYDVLSICVKHSQCVFFSTQCLPMKYEEESSPTHIHLPKNTRERGILKITSID